MKKLKEKEKKDEMKETQEEELRQTILLTSMLIHTNMRHNTSVISKHRYNSQICQAMDFSSIFFHYLRNR